MEKECGEIRAMLYKWTTAHRIEEGFSLQNRTKRAENTPG